MRLIRLFGVALTGVLLFSLAALPVSARLLIEIDKSSQQMTVSRDGRELYVCLVSTGIARYDTPSGQYTPFRMEKDHFSKEWYDAPMPNSIFFTRRGHAIHGTDHVRAIGRSGVARLRAAGPRQRQRAVGSGEAGGHAQHPRGADRREVRRPRTSPR